MSASKKALSLLEIIISTVILALVITGLANILLGGSKLIKHARFRMAGGEIGRKFLDPLQYYVKQDGWDASCFGTTKVIANCPNVPTTSSPYSAAYSFSDIGSNIRKVKLTVTWTE